MYKIYIVMGIKVSGNKFNLGKNSTVFFAGLLFSLLLLEIILRLGGVLYSSFRKNNNFKYAPGGAYKILCLGESTTMMGEDSSYPRQLENFLNSHSDKIKFKVINGGIAGIQTSGILANLK
ncbi:MAG: hypothetical protein HQL27_09490, partial [Candidatus Omnitrophica bacterium]|nr:hypothetical protein [Candidatus Omnitrophota bacterium]